LEEVLQLADYRHLLFQGAKTPAFIARFINSPPQPRNHMVNFNAPKFNRDGLRQGLIKVDPSSRIWIPLADILAATDQTIEETNHGVGKRSFTIFHLILGV
jgi:hypothetical protein